MHRPCTVGPEDKLPDCNVHGIFHWNRSDHRHIVSRRCKFLHRRRQPHRIDNTSCNVVMVVGIRSVGFLDNRSYSCIVLHDLLQSIQHTPRTVQTRCTDLCIDYQYRPDHANKPYPTGIQPCTLDSRRSVHRRMKRPSCKLCDTFHVCIAHQPNNFGH